MGLFEHGKVGKPEVKRHFLIVLLGKILENDEALDFGLSNFQTNSNGDDIEQKWQCM